MGFGDVMFETINTYWNYIEENPDYHNRPKDFTYETIIDMLAAMMRANGCVDHHEDELLLPIEVYRKMAEFRWSCKKCGEDFYELHGDEMQVIAIQERVILEKAGKIMTYDQYCAKEKSDSKFATK